MSIIRSPRPTNRFEIIPHTRLRNANLSFRARGILERLLSNDDNFSMTATDLARESPCEGRFVILKALRELRDAGFVQTVTRRGDRGRLTKRTYVYDAPHGGGPVRGDVDAEVQPPNLGHRDSVGAPTKNNKEVRTKKQQHARVPAGATRAAASTSIKNAAIKGKESKALAIIQGVACWTHADKQAAGQLAGAYGAAAVERAAQAVREGGAIPLPGRVFLKLQGSAEEDRAATANAATQRRLAELEAMSRSRGAREMDEMLAAKPEPEPGP